VTTLRVPATVARFGAAVVLAGAALVASAPPCAAACSCAPTAPARAIELADAVFIGRVVANGIEGVQSYQIFEVDGVAKGKLGLSLQVTGDLGNPCHLLFPVGRPTAVALQARRDGGWSLLPCSSMTPAQVRAVTGDLRDPNPSIPGAPGREAALSGPPRALPGWAVVLLGAVAGVVAIAAGIVAADRGERRARHRVASTSLTAADVAAAVPRDATEG